jgi:hypothetical protein
MSVSQPGRRAKIQRIPRVLKTPAHFLYNFVHGILHFSEQCCIRCFKWTNSQYIILLHPSIACEKLKQLNPLFYKHLEQRSHVIQPTCCQYFCHRFLILSHNLGGSLGSYSRRKIKHSPFSPYLIYATVTVVSVQSCNFKLHIYPGS